MIIYLKKFGTTLASRQLGKEALAVMQSSLREMKDNETIEVDFEGVITFTPSWGDEFLTPLLEKYKEKLILKNTENVSVQATLRLLKKVHSATFKIGK